jgi:predicted ATPase
MIISRVILTNWKNFPDADVPLTDRVFIIGANAAGKSNFLDVFRFLRDIVKQAGGLQYAVVNERGGISKIRSLAARRISYIGIEIHLSESSDGASLLWKYALKIKNTGGGIREAFPQVKEETVYDVKKKKWILSRKDTNGEEDSETLKFTLLEQPTANKDFREIYHFFQETQYLHIVPQLIRDSASYTLATNKEDFYGRNLLDRMGKINKNTRDSYLRRINEVLQIAVPQLKNIAFVADKKGVPHLEAVYEHWRDKGAKQQENQFSDGTLRLIGFMWALLDGQETILLEEPELYLHSAIVKQLPEFIYNMQRNRRRVRQVFISTHSYEILSHHGIAADETVILQPGKEGTKIILAEQDPEVVKYLESGFSIAETIIPKIAPKNIQNILTLKN